MCHKVLQFSLDHRSQYVTPAVINLSYSDGHGWHYFQFLNGSILIFLRL